MKKILKIVLYALVTIFALIGVLFVGVFIAMQFGWLNVRGSIAQRNSFFASLGLPTSSDKTCLDPTAKECSWAATPEWATIKAGLTKDAPVIEDVSIKTGVPERLIAATVVPEQIRFFTSERDVFKSYFEPLQILGSLSQFSLGVSGIKQQTADTIEMYAASTTSSFYPGGGAAGLIAYDATTTSHDSALYDRLTDPNNHYYSYLYTALYIKEIEAQWQNARFDVSHNPGAITTLFNIGFQGSHPNANPQTAGAAITTGGQTYSYGELGADFYNSDELHQHFFEIKYEKGDSRINESGENTSCTKSFCCSVSQRGVRIHRD